MRQFVLGMACGAGLLFVAMHYHVVRSDNGVSLVPKISNDLSDTYVDTRDFDLNEWQDHKPLAAAILKSNQSHLLKDSSLKTFRESIGGLVDGLFNKPD